MIYKEFLELKNKKHNFNLSNGITYEEIMVSVKNDGYDIYSYVISEQVFNKLISLVTDVYQPIRDWLNESITVNSGIRSDKSYARLISQGLFPSKTSDHYCGQKIGGIDTSAGALDITPKKMKVEDLFNKLVSFADKKTGIITLPTGKKIQIGQCLLEYSGKSAWVHISADRTKYNKKANPYAFHFAISKNGTEFTQV